MSYAIYSDSDINGSLLLVDHSLWVINGEWQLQRADDLFIHEKTTTPFKLNLLGHIDYDGDYNSTLNRFRNGEGEHIATIVEPVIEVAQPEICKRKYYGIECSCSKCIKGK